jgi:hypothetical protein
MLLIIIFSSHFGGQHASFALIKLSTVLTSSFGRALVTWNLTIKNKKEHGEDRSPRVGNIRYRYACCAEQHDDPLCSSYSKLLAQYMKSVGADITTDLCPPKSLFIEVRVKQDYGELETPDGDVSIGYVPF